jgi:hypothetical protein
LTPLCSTADKEAWHTILYYTVAWHRGQRAVSIYCIKPNACPFSPCSFVLSPDGPHASVHSLNSCTYSTPLKFKRRDITDETLQKKHRERDTTDEEDTVVCASTPNFLSITLLPIPLEAPDNHQEHWNIRRTWKWQLAYREQSHRGVGVERTCRQMLAALASWS